MRSYKRKTTHIHITEALLNQARDLIKKGVSVRQAAQTIGCSHVSLLTRLKKGVGSVKLGRFRSIFSKEQEETLVRHCVELDKRFFGLTLKSLRVLLYSYAVKNGIDHRFSETTKLAGRDFTRAFMKRNHLSLREPRKTSVARIMGFNRTQITSYFKNLEEAMEKYGFTPDRLYNMDETGIQTIPSKIPKHVAPTGKREVAKSVAAEQGQTVSVACSMSAIGHFVPPYFIFARKRLNLLLIKNGPVGCDMAVTDKGYMNTPTFVKWLHHFKKYTNPSFERPILLILDNHISHVSLEAITWAKENHIHMLSLPPHSSHKTQPLDRNFFRPLKAFYDAAVDDWSVCHPGQVLSVYEVAEMFKIAFQKAATLENAVQGFKVTGIFPLDRNKFTDVDFLPSEVTDQSPDDGEEAVLEEGDDRFIVFLKPDERSASENTELLGDENRCVGNEPASNATAHQDAAVLSTPVPTEEALPGPSGLTSPEEIIPLPKIKIRRKRSGRGLKSVLLTSTPNKARLEVAKENAANSSKKAGSFGKAKPRKLILKKTSTRARRSSPQSSSSDSGSSFSVHNSSSDLVMSEEDNEFDESINSDHSSGKFESLKLQKGDFAVIKVQGKTKSSFRLYVVKVVDTYDDGFGGMFFKRAPNSQRFIETPEEAFFEKKDVHMKLTDPIIHTNSRFQNSISFTEDLAAVH